MPFELPVDPREERRNRVTRWLGTAFGIVLVVLVVYFGYIGYEGSRQLTNADSDSTDAPERDEDAPSRDDDDESQDRDAA